MKRVSSLTLFMCAAAVASGGQAPSSRPDAVETIESPAGPGTAQPQLAALGDRLILSWIARTGPNASLQFAERTATGWSEPRTAASGENWFVNWADVPSVVPLADGSLAAHWLQKSGPGTYAYDVRLSFSRDGGRSWTPSITPHHDGTQTEHGFASLFPHDGGLGLVWLDGRDMKPSTHDSHDGGAAAGSMTLRAAVFDAKGVQQAESLIDPRVCECCPTAVAVTADGPIAAYRDRGDTEIRDIYVSRFVGGTWTEGRAVHADNWKIPACPVNGPALSARGRDVAIAWFNATGNQGKAYVAFSKDAGATFSAPVRVDESGTLGRVDVELIEDGSAVVSWIELADQRAEFRVRRVDGSGTRGSATTVSPIASGRNSGYPRMARHGMDLIVAWTDTDGPRVRTARLPAFARQSRAARQAAP